MFGPSKDELRQDLEYYTQLWMDACDKNEQLRRERDDLLHTTALMVQTIDQQSAVIKQKEATIGESSEAVTQAWDNFLKQHEDELVNLRQISKNRKKEVAKLNQQLADKEREAEYYYNLWNEVRKDHQDLSQQFAKREQNPMLEVRQAHQEATKWQERYEEAQEKLEDAEDRLQRLESLLGRAYDIAADMEEENYFELSLQQGTEPWYVSKTYISGEEVEAAYDRHWLERDK